MFQIIRCMLDEKDEIIARPPLQPLHELWEDAATMAAFDSSHRAGAPPVRPARA